MSEYLFVPQRFYPNQDQYSELYAVNTYHLQYTLAKL